jgi:aspartate carbamoyltransferase regulatory subunit
LKTAGGDATQLLVRKIENGTVVDHVPAWEASLVAKVFGIDRLAHDVDSKVSVAILQNVPSSKLGRKDVIKVDSFRVDERDADILGLIFPQVTINYVKDWKVTKYNPKIPEMIEGKVRCPELLCITNAKGEPVTQRFRTLKKEKMLQCAYCDTFLEFDRIPEFVRT